MKLSLDDQYNLAAKIQNLVIFVGMLTPDELEALQEMKESLLAQRSKLNAISGTIVPMADADNKVAHYTAMLKRIDAIVAIHETNIEMQDADKKLEDGKASQEQIARAFGLVL